MRFDLWEIFFKIFITTFIGLFIIGGIGSMLSLAAFVIWGIWIAIQSVKGLIIVLVIILYLIVSITRGTESDPNTVRIDLRAINSSDGSIWGYDDLPSENDSKINIKRISGRWNSSILMGMGVDGISKAIKYRAEYKKMPRIYWACLRMPLSRSL